MKIYSFSPFGYEGSLVTVEVDLRRGIPAIDVVGLADSSIKESRERMRSAIRNSNYEFPMERVLISLSPADIKKEGAGFDLAIALSVLGAAESLKVKSRNCGSLLEENILVMGELELSGKVRGVRGIHAAVSTAIESGIMYCIVPSENADEAREVSGMKVFAAENLVEAFEALHRKEVFTGGNNSFSQDEIPEGFENFDDVLFPKKDEQFDFSMVRGHGKLIRALQIAACGGHNLLAFGPPGCGKTMCLQRFGELLPGLTVEEAFSVTRIHSLAGILGRNVPLVRRAPFRMPHQTATIEGICGGGMNCRPGEISLAHNGVLFLDEAAEFRSSVLQMLRVPLESKSITLSRAGRMTCYPAGFQLLMATNPCPCGNYGSDSKICLCSARSVEMYWKKFSGPLLDRIDIRVKVESKENEESDYRLSLSSDELRKKIAVGVKVQRNRQGKKNSSLQPDEILKYCKASDDVNEYLSNKAEENEFSPRAVSSCLKVGRTIADMEEKEFIEIDHIKEAIELRKTEGGMCM